MNDALLFRRLKLKLSDPLNDHTYIQLLLFGARYG